MKTKLSLLLCLLAAGQLFAQVPQLKINSGHADAVTSVCYSPDDKYIASGSNDKTIKLWDVATGKELKTFIEEQEVVTSIKFTPDGKHILSATTGSGVKVWDIISGNYKKILDDGFSHFVDISKNGRYIIYEKPYPNRSIELYDISAGKVISSLVGHDTFVNCAKFSPNGRYIVSGSSDKTIKLWDVKSGTELKSFRGHNDIVSSVNFSPDSKYIVSGGGNNDKTVRVWNISNGTEVLKLEGHSSAIQSVCFSPDGRYVVGGGFDEIKFWDIQTRKEVKSYSKKKFNQLYSFSYSHSGKYLVCGYNDKTIGIWDITTDKEIASLPSAKMEMNQVAFLPDGKSTINICDDLSLKLWNLEEVLGVRTLLNSKGSGTENYYQILGFSNDYKHAIYNHQNKIFLYDLTTKERIKTFIGHEETVHVATFSPDGRYIASGSYDRTVKLWDVESGSELKTFKGHSDVVTSVNFSSDGRYIISGGGCEDKTVRVWEVSSGSEKMTLAGHTNSVQSVCFSPDGRYIVSGSADGSIKVWSASTGSELKNLSGEKKSMISSVCFSSNGKYLVSGHFYQEYAIKLWDFESGQLIRIFEGHTGGVKSVQFSPDGKYIVSASADGSIKLWDIATGECLITRYDVPNSDDWVAVTPDGRFDGTDAGMKLLYYVKDLEVIPLESFYERFYTPGLAARVMSGSAEVNVKQYAMGNDIKLPPSVRIVSPTASDKFKTDQVEVVVEATDQGGGVDEIRLYQNGKLVSEEQRGFRQVQQAGEKVTKKYSILLVSGSNELKATAFNRDRTEAVPYAMSIELEKAISSSNLYLVAIGVNKYKNEKYNLTYSVSDAEGFAQSVAAKSKGIFSSIKTVMLKDEQCTKAGILSQLAELSKMVKPEDVLIFYYAGHGVMSEGSESNPSEFYFVPHDVTKMYGSDEMLNQKGISASELRRALVSIKAQKQLIVMDACQSGGATELLAMRGAAEEKALMQLARSAGIAVLASTGTEQFATEVKQLGHGVFTYSLLDGLNGKADGGAKDGKITIKELAAFLEDNVPELTKQYRGSAQYPNTSIRGMDFPIVVWK